MLFCHYRYLAVEYLLVAVLDNLSSMRVNENLDINPTHYLDIDHADIMARIDLTEWETNPKSTRYLTFLKGRSGRKVADFFMDFFGASEGLNTKAQNRGLLQAVDDFTAEAQLDEAERQNVRQLTKYIGGGLTINFDAMLLDERIFWDPATDTLTIKRTPPNLRDQLQRRTSGGK